LDAIPREGEKVREGKPEDVEVPSFYGSQGKGKVQGKGKKGGRTARRFDLFFSPPG